MNPEPVKKGISPSNQVNNKQPCIIARRCSDQIYQTKTNSRLVFMCVLAVGTSALTGGPIVPNNAVDVLTRRLLKPNGHHATALPKNFKKN